MIRQILIDAIIVIAISGCASTGEGWFFVQDASLTDLPRHKELSRRFLSDDAPKLGYAGKEFVVTGHRIVQGRDVVLAFRKSFSERPFALDAAQFTKITVLIPSSDLRNGGVVTIPESDRAFAYYSSTSSSFPGAGGCFGYASSGTIRINSLSDHSVIGDVHLKFRLSGPMSSSSSCTDYAVQGRYELVRVAIDDLTPWQGAPAQSLYEETIRKDPERN